MTANLLDTGKRFFEQVIKGGLTPNYGFYVGYSNKPVEEAPEVSKEYFDTLAKGTSTGFARVPITTVVAQDMGLLFIGMLTSDDLVGGHITRNTVLTTATLVNLGDTDEEDIFLYTAVLKQPVKVVEGANITINVKFSLG